VAAWLTVAVISPHVRLATGDDSVVDNERAAMRANSEYVNGRTRSAVATNGSPKE
jgi:hypothetical protein